LVLIHYVSQTSAFAHCLVQTIAFLSNRLFKQHYTEDASALFKGGILKRTKKNLKELFLLDVAARQSILLTKTAIATLAVARSFHLSFNVLVAFPTLVLIAAKQNTKSYSTFKFVECLTQKLQIKHPHLHLAYLPQFQSVHFFY
jgi:hypothetical protein